MFLTWFVTFDDSISKFNIKKVFKELKFCVFKWIYIETCVICSHRIQKLVNIFVCTVKRNRCWQISISLYFHMTKLLWREKREQFFHHFYTENVCLFTLISFVAVNFVAVTIFETANKVEEMCCYLTANVHFAKLREQTISITKLCVFVCDIFGFGRWSEVIKNFALDGTKFYNALVFQNKLFSVQHTHTYSDTYTNP